DISTTCLRSLAPNACMGMPHEVFAKRLAVAVEMLRKIVAVDKSKMTMGKANAKAMKLAEADPQFVRRTLREWAKEIGCSAGLIPRLRFWREVAKRTGRARKPKAPRVVSITDKVLAVTPDPQVELSRLIAEQNADREPSPLENGRADKGARIRHRKKL